MDASDDWTSKKPKQKKSVKPRFGEIRHEGAKLYLFRVSVDENNELLTTEILVNDLHYPMDKAIANMGAEKVKRYIEKARKQAISGPISTK